MEKLLINHRKRLDGNVGEIVRLEIQMELPCRITKRLIAGKSGCNVRNMVIVRRIRAGKFQFENTSVQPTIQLLDNIT